MAVTLTGAGGLFTRIGHHAGLLNTLNNFIGTTTFGPAITTIRGDYASTNQDLVDAIYAMRESYRGSHGSLATYLAGLAQQTLIDMVDDDVTLTRKTLEEALKELIDQMGTSDDVNGADSVSATVAADGGNTGDAIIVASVVGPKGKTLQYLFNEVMELKVTGDSQTSTATASQEPLELLGEPAVDDPLAWDWPAGSGASTSLTLVDADLDNSGGQLLTNGHFSDFTVANTPDNWNLVVGTPGTTVFSSGSGDAFDSTGNALKITGDGAEFTHLTQTFNSGSGTAATLSPNTVYAVNLFAKDSGAGLVLGTIRVALVNGSNAVVNDDEGTPNSVTFDYSDTTTAYQDLKTLNSGTPVFFRTPSVLPSQLKLEIKVHTNLLTSGQSFFIDHVALTPAVEAYTGGPWVAGFSGATEVVIDDKWTITVAATNGAMQKAFERFFGMRELGLTLPFQTDASETVGDALVTI